MPLLMRIKEFFCYVLTYTFYTFLFLCLISSKLGQIIDTLLNKRNNFLDKNNDDILLQQAENSHINIDKANAILDFINAYIPSNGWIIVFLGMAFLIFMILINIKKNKELKRYSYWVFIIMAFGSIASGASSLILLINAVLILGFGYIKFFTEINILAIDIFFITMLVIYTIIAYATLYVEKTLSYSFIKSLK